MPDMPVPVAQSEPVERKKPVAVLYGAASKHTRAIAERVADGLRVCGLPVQMHSVWGLEPFDLGCCAAAVLAAPVHRGKHEEAMVDFVKAHRGELERLPVAFISAKVGEADAQAFGGAPEGQVQFDGDVQMVGNPFFAETGWHPTRVSSFAGAISYTHYNFFVRWAMKLLAPKGGAGDGGDPDGEHADPGWHALDVFVNEFARESCAAADQAAGGPLGAPTAAKLAE